MGEKLKAVFHPHKQHKIPASHKHFSLAEVLDVLLPC